MNSCFLYLFLAVTGFDDIARAKNQQHIFRKDQFSITGNGTSNEFKTKIDLHVESTDGKPLSMAGNMAKKPEANISHKGKNPVTPTMPAHLTGQSTSNPTVPGSAPTSELPKKVAASGRKGKNPIMTTMATHRTVQPSSIFTEPGNVPASTPTIPTASSLPKGGAAGGVKGRNPTTPTMATHLTGQSTSPGPGHISTSTPPSPTAFSLPKGGAAGSVKGRKPTRTTMATHLTGQPTSTEPGEVSTSIPPHPTASSPWFPKGGASRTSQGKNPTMSTMATNPTGQSFSTPTRSSPVGSSPRLPERGAGSVGKERNPTIVTHPTGQSIPTSSSTEPGKVATSTRISPTASRSSPRLPKGGAVSGGNGKNPSVISTTAQTPSVHKATTNPSTHVQVTASSNNPTPESALPTTSPGAGHVSPTASATQFTELEKQAAKEHNFYRSLHDSNATLLDYNLNVDARRYAEELAQEGRLVQTNQEVLRGKNQGENLAKDCSKYDLQRKMKRAINRWYKEACSFNFDKPMLSNDTIHFTQLAWKGTKKLGVGVAPNIIAGKNCLFIVARYLPRGNIPDQVKANIGSPLRAVLNHYCDES